MACQPAATQEPHASAGLHNERRAINLDPNCGWDQGKADVLYVADAFQVMAKVNEMLKSNGRQKIRLGYSCSPLTAQ
jgi:hypothetical protein